MRPASHSSNSLKKRFCAWPAVRSRKPSTSAPARPNMLAENAVPMPCSGRARPGFQLLEQRVEVARADRHAGDHVRDRAHRLQQAPEGAEQAEEDHQPRHVARQFAALVEARGDAVEQAAHRRGREGEALLAVASAQFARGQHARHRRQQLGRGQGGEARARVLPGLEPRHLGRRGAPPAAGSSRCRARGPAG